MAQTLSAETIKRFWAKVNKDGPVPPHAPELGPCWIWMASLRNKGYGAFAYTCDGTLIQDRASRVSFVLSGGVLCDGECVLHRCDVPGCVNPSHLFAGTTAVNNEDMRKKGRRVPGGSKTPVSECNYERGVNHHAAVLTPDIVRQIRNDRASGLSYGALSLKYGGLHGLSHMSDIYVNTKQDLESNREDLA